MPSVSKSFQVLPTPATPGLTRRQTLAVLMPLVAGHYSVYAQTELTDLARIRASGLLKVAVYKDNARSPTVPRPTCGGWTWRWPRRWRGRWA
jgi:hypothetical protein